MTNKHDSAIIFLYTGEYGVVTDSSGLYYMRARYYDPTIKRFINQDVLTGSITDSPTLNRYAYVNGNPISLSDPFGLSPQIEWSENRNSFLCDLILGFSPNNANILCELILLDDFNRIRFVANNTPFLKSNFSSRNWSSISDSIKLSVLFDNNDLLSGFEQFWDDWKYGAKELVINHKEGVELIKAKAQGLSSFWSGTLSIGSGGGLNIGPFSYMLSSGLCFDTNGNIGFQSTFSTKLSPIFGTRFFDPFIFLSTTNADDISDLRNFGFDIGTGSLSYNMGMNNDNDVSNKGISFSYSPYSSGLSPYFQWNNTDVYMLTNIFDDLISLDEKIIRWLDE